MFFLSFAWTIRCVRQFLEYIIINLIGIYIVERPVAQNIYWRNCVAAGNRLSNSLSIFHFISFVKIYFFPHFCTGKEKKRCWSCKLKLLADQHTMHKFNQRNINITYIKHLICFNKMTWIFESTNSMIHSSQFQTCEIRWGIGD